MKISRDRRDDLEQFLLLGFLQISTDLNYSKDPESNLS
jgi:hypothetical protein